MKNLYLIGGGGFASEVLFVIERLNKIQKKWKSIFIVDDVKENGDKVREYEVIGNIDYLNQLSEEIDVIITINDPEPRKKIIETLKSNKKNVSFPNIFDTTSIVDEKYLTIGEGNIIMHYVILSTQLVIGDFNIFNSYAGIGHDSVIGNYNTFNPRVAISGKVIMNDLNSFGVNSTVLQNKKIGSRNQIWLNTTIVKNLKDNGTYFGIPAKKVDL